MMRKTILHGTRHVVASILLAAAFLSLALPSDAAPITRKQAEQRAAKFFHKRMARKAAPVQLSLALEKPTDATSAGYYIYNKVGGGYAIVSADDTQTAIIGFSDSGHIDADEMPDNMRWWLDGFYRQATAEEQTDYPDPIAPMLTSHWGQNAPYNLQTPLFSGAHAPAGCGAVALAQIIRYQHWPDSVGYIPKTSQCEELPPTAFDWDKLLDTYDADSPADCQEEVAKLMRYLGQAISTTYGKSSSKIYAEDVHSGLVIHLGYQCILQYRSGYSSQILWENEMYQSLQNNSPIFYGGEKASGGGHAFVCDGYQEGYFHINWGWTGTYDGFFLLSDLSPTSTNTYNRKHYAICNINPYKGGVFVPANYIQVTDMIFNPELSREGCLLRENEESDFTDIVIQEDRSFQIDFRGKAKTIQYGLALCYDGQIKEILADTLLDVSNINSSEQRLSFRFSIGSHNHCATYQIRSVSRIHDDDDWAFNDEDDNLGDNYYKAEITRKQLYLHYKNLNFDNLSFNLKTGFGTDEKFVTIDEQGIPSQNLKLRFHYSGEPANHYFDYGLGVFTEFGEMCQLVPLLHNTANKSEEVQFVFDADLSALPDWHYFLKGIYRECGFYEDWLTSWSENTEERVNLVKQGNRIYVEPTYLVTPSCSKAETFTHMVVYDLVNYKCDSSTGNYHSEIQYIVYNPSDPGFVDYGLGLFHADTLQQVLSSHYCEYLTRNRVSNIETVQVPGNLPEGEYQIKGIGRDSNSTGWECISTDDAVIYAHLKNDTLFTMNSRVSNTRFLQVDSIVYLNDNMVRVFLNNPTDAPITGTLSFTFHAPDMYEKNVKMKVSLGPNESKSQDINQKFNTHEIVAYTCGTDLLDGRQTIAEGSVKPLSLDIDFDNVIVDPSEDMVVFDQFMLNYDVSATPAAFRTTLVARNVDASGKILAETSSSFSGNMQSFRCDVDLQNAGIPYSSVVNSRIHFELGYLDYFNDTVIVYRSPDYLVAPFVVVQTYQDNVISEQKQRVVDNWTIPENALFVSFQNAIQTGRVMSVTPNQNPNTVYLIGGDQPIPVGLEDCFVINNTYLNEEEFHIEDGYPVTNKIRGSRIDYQLHFNDGEWMLLGSPFDMVKDTDALEQLDEIMTFDRFQDNTLYFKKYDKSMHSSIRNQPFLVKGSQKNITFKGSGSSSRIADDIYTVWGNFNTLKHLIPYHYDVMYQLSPDGSCFRITQGEVPPFRYILVPNGEDAPERIKVVIEGYDPPTAITDVREQPQVKARYATDGRAVGNGYHGIVVEVDGNGKARKVVRR